MPKLPVPARAPARTAPRRAPAKNQALALLTQFRENGYALLTIGHAEVRITRDFGSDDPRLDIAWWSSNSNGPRGSANALTAASDLKRAGEIGAAIEALLNASEGA